MKYEIEFITRVLSEQEYQGEFDFLIDLLQTHGISQVELLFAFAWGNYYRNWTPLLISPTEMRNEIQKAQAQEAGKWGSNDLFISLPDRQINLLFCHESDVHLEYHHESQLTEIIVSRWGANGLLHRI